MNALELLESGEGSDFTIITSDGPRYVHLSHIRGARMFGAAARLAAATNKDSEENPSVDLSDFNHRAIDWLLHTLYSGATRCGYASP